MAYDTLLATLGLLSLASASTPTTFDPTATRAGVAIAPAALPSAPTAGSLAIDSGDSNRLKWYDGTTWQTAGGGAAVVLPANEIAFGTGSGVTSDPKFQWTGTYMVVGDGLGNEFMRVYGVNGEMTLLPTTLTIGTNSGAPSGAGITLTGNVVAPFDLGSTLRMYPDGASGGVEYACRDIAGAGDVGANGYIILNGDPDGSSAWTETALKINRVQGGAFEWFRPMLFTPASLPLMPLTGMIAIDSDDANKLKWYDGTTWVDAGSGSPVTPGGSNTEIQYNNSGAFGGIAGFTYVPASATNFDLRATREYTQSAVAANNAGTLSVALNLNPTTAPSNSNLVALFVQNQLTDATGMASRSGRIFGQYTRALDTGFTGTAWDGEMSGHFVEVFKTGSTTGAVNGIRASIFGSSSGTISGINLYVEKTYASSPGNLRGVAITVESAATGTVSQAKGIDITSVGNDTSVGTITDSYGVYIGLTSGTNVTNAYGLYQDDPAASNVFAGRLLTSASTTTRAGLNIAHGAAPTAPADGDFWSTTAGFFGQVNGVTVGPFGAGGGAPSGPTDSFQYNDSGSFNGTDDVKWGNPGLIVRSRIDLVRTAGVSIFSISDSVAAVSWDMDLAGNQLQISQSGVTDPIVSVSNASVGVTADYFFYVGDQSTNGSWRIGRDGDDLIFQTRESGVWVTKQTFVP